MSHSSDPLDEAESLVLHLLETAAKTMELVEVELVAEDAGMAGPDGKTNFDKIIELGKEFKSTVNRVESVLLDEGEKLLRPFEDYQKERAMPTRKEHTPQP